ncbi:hypothetical protein [Flavobacterium notoginsengisoli]|uniref:hypothetical protein n=1 Tax=Flavobacterium notoginsengisoli TaxID=1478199 RepID=UPI00363F4983
MKTYVKLILFFWCLSTVSSYSQVGVYGNKPNKNAVLDLNKTDGTNDKGLLLPKVVLKAINNTAPMTAHVAGMKVYNTATDGTGANAVTPGEYCNDGTQWVRLETNSNLWSTTGNAGTNPAVNFLGTTDAKDFVIKTNNTEQMRITSSTGQLLMGTTTFPIAGGANSKIVIDNGTTRGAIQLIDGTQADGATLISDANGVAKWFQGGNTDFGTGIYYSTVAQNFPVNATTTLQTSKAIKVSEAGSYLVSVRWWGNNDAPNANYQVEANIGLRKNGVEVDVLQQYATQLGTGTTFRVCFTTNLVAVDCAANDVLTVTVNPYFGGNWFTGTAGIVSTFMPTVMVVKL